MRKLGTILLAAAILLTAGCGGEAKPVAIPIPPAVTITPTVTPTPAPDEGMCRAAIVSDYETGWEGADQWPPSTRKPVCAGFSRPTLTRLIDEAIDDIMSGTTGPS